jgi:hypothetical protein
LCSGVLLGWCQFFEHWHPENRLYKTSSSPPCSPASPHSPHKHLACQGNGMEQDKVDSVATYLEMADAKHVSGKHIEGSALLVNKQGGVRKLPVPSDSPNDPLNWSV